MRKSVWAEFCLLSFVLDECVHMGRLAFVALCLQDAAFMRADIVHIRIRCFGICLLMVLHVLSCGAAV